MSSPVLEVEPVSMPERHPLNLPKFWRGKPELKLWLLERKVVVAVAAVVVVAVGGYYFGILRRCSPLRADDRSCSAAVADAQKCRWRCCFVPVMKTCC